MQEGGSSVLPFEHCLEPNVISALAGLRVSRLFYKHSTQRRDSSVFLVASLHPAVGLRGKKARVQVSAGVITGDNQRKTFF